MARSGNLLASVFFRPLWTRRTTVTVAGARELITDAATAELAAYGIAGGRFRVRSAGSRP